MSAKVRAACSTKYKRGTGKRRETTNYGYRCAYSTPASLAPAHFAGLPVNDAHAQLMKDAHVQSCSLGVLWHRVIRQHTTCTL